MTAAVPPLPPGEPDFTQSDPHALLCGYLDYYRSTVLRKLTGLPDDELRRSRAPSGWTPLELIRHLTFVELRWLCWGFAAEEVAEPWGDWAPNDRWQVPDGMSAEAVFAEFHAQCERSRTVAARATLETRARPGGRFPDGAQAPSLGWILLHVLQEYARHAGQLDVVRELADGTTGE